MDKDYEEFKKKLRINSINKNKGKLIPHTKLIERMIEDGLTQKDMRVFLKQEYNLDVTQSNFSLFIKKLKLTKIVKMELINGTNFVAAPIAPIKEKKIKPTTVNIPENETNKTIPKVVSEKVEKSENSNEQTITKKNFLNLPVRKIKTGEIIRVDTSQFK